PPVASMPSTISFSPGAAETKQSARVIEAKVPNYVWAVLAGGTSITVGILWDSSLHRTIGRDTFWTPAHMAIYIGGLLAGLTCGWMVLRTTFFWSPEERGGAVRIWGFPGPLGACITIWGLFAMITSAPFDNGWHTAYGID